MPLILPGSPEFEAVLKKEIGSTDLRKVRESSADTPEDIAREMGVSSLVAVGFDGTGYRVKSVMDIPSDFNPDCLKSSPVVINGEAFAQSDLFIGEQWSQGSVHGPDMMLAVGPVIENLLDPGDSIKTAEQIRFLRPLTSNMNVYAAKEPFHTMGPGEKPEDMVVKASFITKEGKTIYCFAYANGEPLRQKKSESNNHAFKAFENWKRPHFDDRDNAFLHMRSFDRESGEKFKLDARKNPVGLALSTIMDIALVASRAFNDDQRFPYHGEGLLAAEFKNLEIPDDPESLMALADIDVNVNFEGKKETDNVTFVPYQFQLYGVDDTLVSSGQYLKALVKKHARLRA